MTMFENMHIFNADMLGAKLQHRTQVVTAQRVRFISAPLADTDNLRKIDWQMCFHTHYIVQCIPVAGKGK